MAPPGAFSLKGKVMTNQIVRIFQFEGTEIRVDTDEHGEPLFCASDVARTLGYSNPHDATNKHCRNLVKREVPNSEGRMRQTNFIPEPDLYRLIFNSRLPAAQAFEEWVVGTVLPNIRKTGRYTIDLGKAGKRKETPEEKEARLWERERRLTAQQKAKGWRIYKRIAEQQQRAELAATYDIKIAEVLTGNPQPALLPKTEEKADWVSPEQIADRFGVSVQRIGLTVSALWGKGPRLDIEGIREVRTGPAANGRQVPLSFYSSRAVEMIRERLIEDGYIQGSAA